MKKSLCLLIVLLVIVSCVPHTAYASSSDVYEITVSVPDVVIPGDTFAVRYTLTNTDCDEGISGGSVVLTYDDALLTFSSLAIVSSPANWSIDNWTKAGLTSVLYISVWDETATSSSLAIDDSTVFDVFFTANDLSDDNISTAVSIVDSYQVHEGSNVTDTYYTEILDAVDLEEVGGTKQNAALYIVNDIILKTDSEFDIYDDETYFEPDDEYSDIKALHIENEEIDTATTVSEFLANIQYPANVIILDKDGDELTDDDDEIATGCTAVVINPYTGEHISETVIVVKGDINGDGIANVIDLSLIRGHLNCDIDNPTAVSRFYLQGASYLAAKMTGSSELSVIDLSRLRGYIS